MSNYKNIIKKILLGRSDANIKFDSLCQLLFQLGFEVRIKGSHHIFRKVNILEKINIQKDGNKVKPYQVKQIRRIIIKYKLRLKL